VRGEEGRERRWEGVEMGEGSLRGKGEFEGRENGGRRRGGGMGGREDALLSHSNAWPGTLVIYIYIYIYYYCPLYIYIIYIYIYMFLICSNTDTGCRHVW
jgi:hypothetical protein